MLTLSSRLLIDTVESATGLDFLITFRSVFFGFSISAILFGITLRQGYQYFAYTMEHDSFWQIFIAAAVCVLDTLNGAFGMNFVYCYMLGLLGPAGTGWHVVWNLKALAVTHVLLILLVQGHYLAQIWIFTGSKNKLLKKSYILLAKGYVITVVVLGTVITIVFLTQLPSIDTPFSFSLKLECMLYLGLGTTAFFDCTTAAAMCIILNECSSGNNPLGRKMQQVLHGLIKYIVGTGLMTSFAAIVAIVMYVVRPDTMLYLAIEFSVSRLYANAILANFNTRPSRRQRIDESIELDSLLFEPSGQRGNLTLYSVSGFHRFEFLTDYFQNDWELELGSESQEDPPSSNGLAPIV